MIIDDHIKFVLEDSDFEILTFQDGKIHHLPKGSMCVWGLESTLKRDLSSYYYFECTRQNASKKCVPGKAYVNGVEAEKADPLDRGNYLIKRELVKPPFVIKIESIPAHMVSFRNVDTYPVIYLAKEKAYKTFRLDDLDLFISETTKPKFTAYKSGTDEVVNLKKFKFYPNNIMPWISFTMPDFDIEFVVSEAQDTSKVNVHIDASNIEHIIHYDENGGYPCVISEALYSDDYDFGVEDHYFFEEKVIFKKGKGIKVELYLDKLVNVSCIFGDIDYLPIEQRKVKNEEYDIYYYLFKPIKITGEGTISFKVN